MAPAKRSGTGVDFTPTIHNDTYSFIDPTKISLQRKAVFITGASKGIGRATAISFAKAGASYIAISARSDLSSLSEEIPLAAKSAGRKAPKVLALQVDVTDEASVNEAAQKVKHDFGRLDILVNNAGYLESFVPIAESKMNDWWTSWDVNIKGVYLCCKAFLPLLLQGADRTILNLSSIAAHLVMPGASAYQSAKLALLRFTEFLNEEHSDKGLLAYCAHPGGVPTELALKMPKAVHALLTDTPELAGDTFAWLVEERREWLRGRYVSCTWDMEELMNMKREVEEGNLLKVRMAV